MFEMGAAFMLLKSELALWSVAPQQPKDLPPLPPDWVDARRCPASPGPYIDDKQSSDARDSEKERGDGRPPSYRER